MVTAVLEDFDLHAKWRYILKRKAINALRSRVNAVPNLGDVGVYLAADLGAQDAMRTLVALRFPIPIIINDVARERFTETVALKILIHQVSRAMRELLKGVTHE